MLDFTTELLTRPYNAAEPAAQRSLVDRSPERRSRATIRSTAPSPPKRRRNDAMNVAPPARLQW